MSTLETNNESYSLVLEPEAQFLPEFTLKEEKVSVSVLATVQGQTTHPVGISVEIPRITLLSINQFEVNFGPVIFSDSCQRLFPDEL